MSEKQNEQFVCIDRTDAKEVCEMVKMADGDIPKFQSLFNDGYNFRPILDDRATAKQMIRDGAFVAVQVAGKFPSAVISGFITPKTGDEN